MPVPPAPPQSGYTVSSLRPPGTYIQVSPQRAPQPTGWLPMPSQHPPTVIYQAPPPPGPSGHTAHTPMTLIPVYDTGSSGHPSTGGVYIQGPQGGLTYHQTAPQIQPQQYPSSIGPPVRFSMVSNAQPYYHPTTTTSLAQPTTEFRFIPPPNSNNPTAFHVQRPPGPFHVLAKPPVELPAQIPANSEAPVDLSVKSGATMIHNPNMIVPPPTIIDVYRPRRPYKQRRQKGTGCVPKHRKPRQAKTPASLPRLTSMLSQKPSISDTITCTISTTSTNPTIETGDSTAPLTINLTDSPFAMELEDKDENQENQSKTSIAGMTSPSSEKPYQHHQQQQTFPKPPPLSKGNVDEPLEMPHRRDISELPRPGSAEPEGGECASDGSDNRTVMLDIPGENEEWWSKGRRIVSDQELLTMPITQLKVRLKGIPVGDVMKLKNRRRTLKNRNYARDCRKRRLQTVLTSEERLAELQSRIEELKDIVQRVREERDIYQRCYEEMKATHVALVTGDTETLLIGHNSTEQGKSISSDDEML